MSLPSLSLVLGGAASGKSAFAEALVDRHGANRLYIATAQAWDDEMRTKISLHLARRGPGWRTVEAPLNLIPALNAATGQNVVLLDCATLWLTNHMLAGSDVAAQTAQLLAALQHCNAPVVVVSNEVGMGIVPETALGRRFRDAQGTLNQQIAAQAGLVAMVIAGLPLVLKGHLP